MLARRSGRSSRYPSSEREYPGYTPIRPLRSRRIASGRQPPTERTATRKPPAQRLGVHAGERLVLGEVLEADHDPRPVTLLRGAAEPVGVDELAADGLGQPAVCRSAWLSWRSARVVSTAEAAFEPAADERPPARAVVAQQLRAHYRHDGVEADHPACRRAARSMSGRDTSGSDENATATSASPASSAAMPAPATVQWNEHRRRRRPCRPRLSPGPQPGFVKQSGRPRGAPSRRHRDCAGATIDRPKTSTAKSRRLFPRQDPIRTCVSIRAHSRGSRHGSSHRRWTRGCAVWSAWQRSTLTALCRSRRGQRPDPRQDEQWAVAPGTRVRPARRVGAHAGRRRRRRGHRPGHAPGPPRPRAEHLDELRRDPRQRRRRRRQRLRRRRPRRRPDDEPPAQDLSDGNGHGTHVAGIDRGRARTGAGSSASPRGRSYDRQGARRRGRRHAPAPSPRASATRPPTARASSTSASRARRRPTRAWTTRSQAADAANALVVVLRRATAGATSTAARSTRRRSPRRT